VGTASQEAGERSSVRDVEFERDDMTATSMIDSTTLLESGLEL
jgi:hypothetical protein